MKTIGIVLFISLLALIGCGQNAQEKAIENAIEKESGGKADVNLENGKVSVKTESGEAVIDAAGGSVKLPDNWPGDVHVYQGAKAIMAVKVPQGNLVTLLTKDPAGKVVDKYKEKMTGSGWSEKAAMEMGEGRVFIYEKNKKRANIMIIETEGQTQIRITVTKK